MTPYKFTVVHDLEHEYYFKRRDFCQKCQTEAGNEETIAQRLVFREETAFNARAKLGVC
jgi:hypothetical protein